MKITSIEVLPVGIPVGVPSVNRRAVTAALTQVHTDEGLIGVSNSTGAPDQTRSLIASIEELGQHIIGEDPRAPEHIYEKISPMHGIPTRATAALDIAMYDLLGKATGLPLWRLLGGYRDRIPAYMTTRLGREIPLEVVVQRASEDAEAGFRYMKMNLGGFPSVAAEAARVKAVRDAVGKDVQIMADVNGMWTTSEAIRVGHRIEEYELFWIEDPIPSTNVMGMLEISRALDVPIATGETLGSPAQFLPLLDARAIDIPMMDLLAIGGITPFRKVAAMAEVLGMKVVNHFQPEIAAHLIAGLPNGLILEYGLRTSEMFHGVAEFQDGDVVLSERPGLGLDINWDFVKKYQLK